MSSIKNIVKSSDIPGVTKDLADKSLETEKKGDDVKGAFLALLQGLVGIGGVNISQSAPVEAKAAEYQENQNTPSYEDNSEKYDLDNANEDEFYSKNDDSADEEKIVARSINNSTSDKVDASHLQEKSPSQEVASSTDSVDEATEIVADAEQVVGTIKSGETKEEIQLDSQDVIEDQNTTKQALNKAIVNESAPVASEEVETAVVEEVVAKVSPEADKTQDYKTLENDLNKVSAEETVGVSEDVKVSSKAGEVDNNSTKVDSDKNLAELDESLEEIRKYLSNTPSQSASNSESPKVNPVVEKNSNEMDSVKDALLARLLLGVEQSAFGNTNTQLTSGSKPDFQVISSLGLKDSSGEKLGTEKTQASFLRRDVKAQEFIDKIKEALMKAAANKTNDTISVKVNPAHLGEIKVTVSHKNNEIYAKLVPESKEIEQILKTKSHELNAVIQALGFTPDSVHIQVGSEPNPNLSWNNIFKGNQENASNNGSSKGNKSPFSKHVDVGELIGGSVTEPTVVQESGWVA